MKVLCVMLEKGQIMWLMWDKKMSRSDAMLHVEILATTCRILTLGKKLLKLKQGFLAGKQDNDRHYKSSITEAKWGGKQLKAILTKLKFLLSVKRTHEVLAET